MSLRIGLVSDTHDLMRPDVLAWLRGSDRILHAGDICSEAVLDALSQLAPVIAVRGNNDRGDWARRLHATETVRLGDALVYMVHDLKELASPPGVRVVVSGHSHQPKVEERGGVLYVNPGSAGPRRFRLPISAGELRIAGSEVTAHLIQF